MNQWMLSVKMEQLFLIKSDPTADLVVVLIGVKQTKVNSEHRSLSVLVAFHRHRLFSASIPCRCSTACATSSLRSDPRDLSAIVILWGLLHLTVAEEMC